MFHRYLITIQLPDFFSAIQVPIHYKYSRDTNTGRPVFKCKNAVQIKIVRNSNGKNKMAYKNYTLTIQTPDYFVWYLIVSSIWMSGTWIRNWMIQVCVNKFEFKLMSVKMCLWASVHCFYTWNDNTYVLSRLVFIFWLSMEAINKQVNIEYLKATTLRHGVET